MRYLLILLFTSFILFSTLLKGQDIFPNGFSKEDEKMLQARVKQLDEFFARFNYEEDVRNVKIIDRSDTIMRKKYIFSLFNEDLFKISNDSLVKLVNQFASYVVKYDFKLRFTDEQWFAEANCKVKYKGQEKKLQLVLKPEKIKGFEYKWVIVSAHADFLNMEPLNKNQIKLFHRLNMN